MEDLEECIDALLVVLVDAFFVAFVGVIAGLDDTRRSVASFTDEVSVPPESEPSVTSEV